MIYINKKLSKLIDIVVEVPTIEQINMESKMTTMQYDRRWTAQMALIDALQTLSKRTIYENQTNDLIKKCTEIFETK